MDLQTTIYLVVGLSFALYIGIAIWARAGSTSEFYAAGGRVNPVMNGMATAADWMSAASFISMAGLISNMGYGGALFLMGWTGGYVLLAMLLAPYLRKFGKFTVPQFIGDRFYSKSASTVAVLCLLVASVTYIIGQMTGVGVAFSRFLGVSSDVGIYVGMGIVFLYAVFGGMKGITYTQVAQYIVLILAYTIPAIFISLQLTGNPIPQLGLGSDLSGHNVSLLQKLDQVVSDLGFSQYTTALPGSKLNMFVYTLSLMIGTAGLPHVIMRFFTVPQFIGDRFYSKSASTVAVLCLLVASLTYIIGQMTGVGVAFSRFLGVSSDVGIYVGMGIVFAYAVFGGMKGITYTQVAQYIVLIFAYTIPAIFISLQLTGNPIPQLGLGSSLTGHDVSLLQKLDQVVTDLGFGKYTTSLPGSTLNMFVYTMSLMIGTAGLPHVIMRFFTVPKVKDARTSAGWALVFIAILYTTAPAVAAMAKTNLIRTITPGVVMKDANPFAKD